MFEIKYKDGAARVGLLRIGDRKITTPYVFPVVDPRRKDYKAYIREIKRLGFNAIITNSYLIMQDPELREKAEKYGIKRAIDFNGMNSIVMTDSGAYQIYEYGRIKAEQEEILEFQERIKSDIAVMLDIPSRLNASREEAERDVDETIKRARKAAKTKKERKLSNLLTATVQGSAFPELRRKCARALAELKESFDIFAIGGVVGFLESYRFRELAEIILASKKELPVNMPVHLFGAGHSIFLALATLLGCDLFDSASYLLYARERRFITEHGTKNISEMQFLPCSCNICSRYSLKELKESDGLIALHNLTKLKEEVENIKEAIYQGELWKLAEQRCRAHVSLMTGFKEILKKDHANYFEELEPRSKKTAFFYFGEEHLNRAEVIRHLKKLDNLEFPQSKLILKVHENYIPAKIGSNKEFALAYISRVFGIIPSNVEDIYPLSQHIAESIESLSNLGRAERKAIESALLKVFEKSDFKEIFAEEKIRKFAEKILKIKCESIEALENYGNPGRDDKQKIIEMCNYVFGKGTGKKVFKNCRVEYARTGKIRRIYDSNNNLLATIRANDGMLILAEKAVLKLKEASKFPKNRVIIEDKEACEFIKRGKSVFAKFVESCDENIRANDEVMVVDSNDNLIAYGKARLSAKEMLAFERGMAVDVRFSA